jgi:hypothetical protein
MRGSHRNPMLKRKFILALITTTKTVEIGVKLFFFLRGELILGGFLPGNCQEKHV